jgi:Concanavalin A-like lectin/glucanases superfamily
MPGAAPAIQYRRRPGRTRRTDPEPGARAISQVFNGTSDVVYNTSLPVTAKPYTLAAWVKPTNVNSTEQSVLGIGYDTGSAGCGAAVEIGSDNHWWVRLHNAGSYNMGGSPANNTWYHVALTVSSTGTYTLYVNGTSLGTTSGGSDPATGALSRGAAAHNSTATSFYHYFKGEVEEVAVWNVALSSTDVATLAGVARGSEGAVKAQPVQLQKYAGLCGSVDTGDNFWITWTPDTTVGTTFISLPCGADPQGCSRNPLPRRLFLQKTDPTQGGGNPGPCVVTNRVMVWLQSKQAWTTVASVGSCTYVYTLTVSGSSFTLKTYTPTAWADSASPLNTVTATATTCNPLAIDFTANGGGEYNSCGCHTPAGGFTVLENQA